MNLPSPLYKGRLIKRYKRFLVDVELDSGEIITAHCANPGSMTSLLEDNADVYLSYHDNPKRKLKYSWELVRARDTLVGINTSLPNKIVEAAVAEGLIPELTGYDHIRREVKYGENSRIDLLLEKEDLPPCYVEVKSVTLSRQDELAEFPDSVTTRGAKHLRELTTMVDQGARSVMLFLIQRSDCSVFQTASDLDPAYASGLTAAIEAGVEVLVYAATVTPEAITLAPDIAVTFDPKAKTA